jgi:hypothetical protein
MRNLASRASAIRLLTVGAGVLAAGAAISVPAYAATSPAPSAISVPPAATAASSASSATFKIFNPPSQSGAPSGSPEALTGVYAASPTDVWAVGGATGDPFEHWNGTSWTGQGLPAGLCTQGDTSGALLTTNQCGVSFITGGAEADNLRAAIHRADPVLSRCESAIGAVEITRMITLGNGSLRRADGGGDRVPAASVNGRGPHR